MKCNQCGVEVPYIPVPPITYIKGDATYPQGPGKHYIVHICNDVGAWGKGFVLALSKRWKKPEQVYRDWSKGHFINDDYYEFKLGNVMFVAVEESIVVANLIGQHGLQKKGGTPPIRYDAVRKGLKKVRSAALNDLANVHMPRIGTGLAGGDWSVISNIIYDELLLFGISVTVYDLTRQDHFPHRFSSSRLDDHTCNDADILRHIAGQLPAISDSCKVVDLISEEQNDILKRLDSIEKRLKNLRISSTD